MWFRPQSEGWQDQVAALTGGAPIMRALDSLGGDGPSQLLEVVADGAELVNFGAMTQRPLKITPAQLLFRGITVRGFWGAKNDIAPELIGKMLGELVALAAKGELVLPVEEVFGLEDRRRGAGERRAGPQGQDCAAALMASGVTLAARVRRASSPPSWPISGTVESRPAAAADWLRYRRYSRRRGRGKMR